MVEGQPHGAGKIIQSVLTEDLFGLTSSHALYAAEIIGPKHANL